MTSILSVLADLRSLLFGGISLILLGGCGESRSRPPNVVLVTLDTTRADRLSCYGYRRETTPNLDRLAAQGCRFTRAMAQAAVTPVSHASILTGRNPYSHGLRVLHGLSENRLGDAETTLAEMLVRAGYRTGAFVSAFPVTERFGLHQGFEVFDADFLDPEESPAVTADGMVNTGRNQRGAGETTDRALAWLEQVEEPFFLWVHYFDPHDTQLQPPPEFTRGLPWFPKTLEPRDLLSTIYDVEILYMDAQMGRLFAALDAQDRSGNTVFVVTADHGEGLGDHDWWTHGILYQEQIRVPLVVRAPGLPAATVCTELVRSIDLVPTILDLLDGAAENKADSGAIEGRSLVPFLRGEEAGEAPMAYADSLNMLTYNLREGIQDVKDDVLFCLIEGRFKYIHHLLRPDESELYDLRRDPEETTNLVAEKQEVVLRLRGALGALAALPEDAPGGDRMSEEDRARLRALGYTEAEKE